MILLTVALHVKEPDSTLEVSACYCVCITSSSTNKGDKLHGGATYTPPFSGPNIYTESVINLSPPYCGLRAIMPPFLAKREE